MLIKYIIKYVNMYNDLQRLQKNICILITIKIFTYLYIIHIFIYSYTY